MFRFLSSCGKSINDCKIKTYETDGKRKKNQSSTKGAKLVRVLVRVVRFTRYIIVTVSFTHASLQKPRAFEQQL